jgi:hypothetical protein
MSVIQSVVAISVPKNVPRSAEKNQKNLKVRGPVSERVHFVESEHRSRLQIPVDVVEA